VPAGHYDIDTSRQTWDGLIRKYGDLALLRQPGISDRFVSYMPAQFSALERMGGISNPTDRKALISIISPDTGLPLSPEPSEKDVLVTLVLDDDGAPVLDVGNNPQTDELLKIIAPPRRIGTSRRVLYWVLQVRA
jgi:hypothetical protein